MIYHRRNTRRNDYPSVETQQAEWPAQRGDFVILMLASLALATVITRLIFQQLYHSPFF
jgi:hypothetical protein